MHRHYIRARQESRPRKQVGNMYQVAVEFAQCAPELAVTLQRVLWIRQRDGLEIARQRTDFLHLVRGAKQEVLGFMIEAAQGPNDVADVRTYTKFRHPADIDGDLHRANLTTQQTNQLARRWASLLAPVRAWSATASRHGWSKILSN